MLLIGLAFFGFFLVCWWMVPAPTATNLLTETPPSPLPDPPSQPASGTVLFHPDRADHARELTPVAGIETPPIDPVGEPRPAQVVQDPHHEWVQKNGRRVVKAMNDRWIASEYKTILSSIPDRIRPKVFHLLGAFHTARDVEDHENMFAFEDELMSAMGEQTFMEWQQFLNQEPQRELTRATLENIRMSDSYRQMSPHQREASLPYFERLQDGINGVLADLANNDLQNGLLGIDRLQLSAKHTLDDLAPLLADDPNLLGPLATHYGKQIDELDTLFRTIASPQENDPFSESGPLKSEGPVSIPDAEDALDAFSYSLGGIADELDAAERLILLPTFEKANEKIVYIEKSLAHTGPGSWHEIDQAISELEEVYQRSIQDLEQQMDTLSAYQLDSLASQFSLDILELEFAAAAAQHFEPYQAGVEVIEDE